MPINQNDTLNLAAIDEKLYRNVYDNTIFAPLIGHGSMLTDENGQQEYQPAGTIIEMLDGVSLGSGNDHGILTMSNELEGDPIYGDTTAEGTGEEYGFNHLRVFVCQSRKVVSARSGRMSELRDRVYKIRENARPKLETYFTRLLNAHVIQAVYEGASGNVTAGLSVADNGIGLKKRLPSNFYYQDVDGVLTTIGTAGKAKTTADVTTASRVTLEPFTSNTIEAAALLAQELKISKAILHRGQLYWAWFISPYELSYLRKNDADWLANERAYANGRRPEDSSLATGAINAQGGFMFFVDFLAIRPWDESTTSFEGTAGWLGRGTYYGAYRNDCTYILGKGAIGHMLPVGYAVREQSSDFDAVVEVEGSNIGGFARNDWATADVESTAWVKGQSAAAYITTEPAITNYNTLVIMVDRA